MRICIGFSGSVTRSESVEAAIVPFSEYAGTAGYVCSSNKHRGAQGGDVIAPAATREMNPWLEQSARAGERKIGYCLECRDGMLVF